MNVDKAMLSMIDNLPKNTGKNLEEWISIFRKENSLKYGEIV